MKEQGPKLINATGENKKLISNCQYIHQSIYSNILNIRFLYTRNPSFTLDPLLEMVSHAKTLETSWLEWWKFIFQLFLTENNLDREQSWQSTILTEHNLDRGHSWQSTILTEDNLDRGQSWQSPQKCKEIHSAFVAVKIKNYHSPDSCFLSVRLTFILLSLSCFTIKYWILNTATIEQI